jgi:hypothetical protein
MNVHDSITDSQGEPRRMASKMWETIPAVSVVSIRQEIDCRFVPMLALDSHFRICHMF